MLLLGTCVGVSRAADRPVLHMATIASEVAVWCLSNGFIYEPGFAPPSGAPNIDYEKTLVSPAQAILAVDRGELAMNECVGLETVTQAWAKGAHNLIVVAVNGVSPAYVLIGSKNVKRLEDLKGKVLGSNGMSTTATQAVVSILQKGANLAPERDYSFVIAQTGAARMAALIAGKVDATASFPPTSYKLIDDGYPVLGIERQYVPNYIQGAMVVNRQWAQANRPMLVAIIKTMVQTGRWLRDPSKKNDVVAKLADVTKAGAKLGLDYARRIYSDVITVNGGVLEDAYADRALFTTTFRLLTERGLMTESEYPALDKLVDYSYLNQARRELGMREVKALTP
jgi:hypothetical protein